MKQSQIAAAHYDAVGGKDLQVSHPEIKERYLSGHTHKEIAAELRNLGVKSSRLEQKVGFALRGHSGEWGVSQYEGLLSGDESKSTATKHRSDFGTWTSDEGIGVHGLGPEERIENARAAGKIAGKLVYQRGNGIHGLEASETISNARNAVMKRGDTLWEDSYSEQTGLSEDAYLAGILMSNPPKHESGAAVGRTNWKEILEDLNLKYGLARKPRTKRSLEAKGREILENPFLQLIQLRD